MAQPLIIQYTNLLHKHKDPQSQEVLEFLRTHSDDHVFVRRAEALNYVFRLRSTDLAAAGAVQPSSSSATRSTASS